MMICSKCSAEIKTVKRDYDGMPHCPQCDAVVSKGTVIKPGILVVSLIILLMVSFGVVFACDKIGLTGLARGTAIVAAILAVGFLMQKIFDIRA